MQCCSDCKLETLWLYLPKLSQSSRKSTWIFIERTDAEAKASIFWPPDAKSCLIRKDLDAGKDWGQEEKEETEDELVGWHHQLDRHEFDQTPGQWRTGKPGVLQSMGLQRVGLIWGTELSIRLLLDSAVQSLVHGTTVQAVFLEPRYAGSQYHPRPIESQSAF